MKTLNLPSFTFRYKDEAGKKFIFDVVRGKFVSLTPEEWVRQNFLHFMSQHLGYPSNLTGVEKMLKVNGLSQRCDVVLFNRKGHPVIIVECKAPSIEVDKTTLAQAARYNTTLKVPFLVLTNGLKHYCIFTDVKTGRHSAKNGFPSFEELQNY
ncbi:type I restriction enzyme HsdR N-terminal domain-containing protein [Marinilabilia rubra]|uniref:Restriction endonuclease subunit R n=1 Tax=Marinilabilia rubra TaxID=2162893 RepID=A0A2U2BA33_9BACT|nr:type I restriction enzyme HsdR N-terminal domain-containing protein [Marinilabilia rubra]PWD99928.1 restriction endonuclease subunit R [Marinilabilia rubra]